MPRYPLVEPSSRLCHFTLFDIKAFKFLEDSTEDGADSLYGCIWDMAILEFAMSLHTKRGEVMMIR